MKMGGDEGDTTRNCIRFIRDQSSRITRLDDRAIDVRSPVEERDFSSNLCVQTGSEVHPASCPMVPGILSQGQSAARA
jgi:hypothetical protein